MQSGVRQPVPDAFHPVKDPVLLASCLCQVHLMGSNRGSAAPGTFGDANCSQMCRWKTLLTIFQSPSTFSRMYRFGEAMACSVVHLKACAGNRARDVTASEPRI